MKKQKDFITKEYCVYEHWYEGKCVYVGSGDVYRPFEYSRNERWSKIFSDREAWKEIRFDVVKIIFETDNREEAFKKEEEQTILRNSEGYDLCNIRVGNKFKDKKDSPLHDRDQSGENNGFYGHSHTEETKRRIGEATKKYNEEYGHPSIGLVGPNAFKIKLYYKDLYIRSFESLRECRDWAKKYINGFPVKALKKMVHSEKEYEAFHKKHRRYNGYKIIRTEKENEKNV